MSDQQPAVDLTERLAAIHSRIAANSDAIPVASWGFDERATEMIRSRKHALVNKTIGAAGQRNLKKQQKQKIAKNLGGVPRTVGEIFGLLAASSLSARIRRGPTVPQRPPPPSDKKKEAAEVEAKENNGPALEEWKLDLLKQKGVGRRPIGKRPRADTQEDKEGEGEAPFKKQKQHKPLTPAEREERKEKRKQNRQKKASQSKVQKNAEVKPPRLAGKTEKTAERKDEEQREGAMAFSKLDFVLKPDPPKRRPKDKFAGRDYAALLQKAQKRRAHVAEVREKDPERADRLQQNIRFETALKRAQGEKVKDDVEKLAKAVKRKAKSKEKQKAKWGERVRKVDDEQQKRQEKRTENIAKRRDQKVKKKLERARKKGRLV